LKLVRFVVVIPARFGSSRLPGKALALIGGRPMIAWAHERAKRSSAEEVLVATDDERIAAACETFGARVLLTRGDHASGTDRIAEVAERLGWEDDQIVVNVQGDEPLIPPTLIDQVAWLAEKHPDAAVATLVTPITAEEDSQDPSLAKVVADRNGRALYFSRAPIPWARDGGEPPRMRHVGIYAYRVAALRELSAAGPCPLEEIESLEQLRVLWLGLKIIVADARETPSMSVDNEADLEAVRRFIMRHGIHQ
jgi:3-deoxy-manno-octulosonate cytidylyltransferase (CMP-KDO synthetase)